MAHIEVSSSHSEVTRQTPLLTPEQIFSSPDGLPFSEFGSRLFGVVARRVYVMDPHSQFSSERVNEVVGEIYATCAEIGIDPKRIDTVSREMFRLISEREQSIKEKFPLG